MRDRRRSCGCEVPVRNVVVLPTARRRHRRFSRQIHDDDDGGRSFVRRTGGGVVVVDLGVAEAAMFRQRAGGRERLPAGGAADALAAVGVRPLVSAEVRELRVGALARVTAERLDARVDVLVLLEAAGGRERLAASGTLVLSRTCCRQLGHLQRRRPPRAPP